MDKKPSVYTTLYWLIQDKKIEPEVLFSFLEFFWPSFIVYKDYIILKENFSEEKIEDLIRRKEKIEFWMNLFITDPYFENEENEETKAESLARSLA